MKLSIIKAQLKATSNMLQQFHELKLQNIDSGYDTKELSKVRSSIKSALTALNKQVRDHPDYIFEW